MPKRPAEPQARGRAGVLRLDRDLVTKATRQRTRLATVDAVPAGASVIEGGVSGGEAHDLVCGKCGQVVAAGMSPSGLSRVIATSGALILSCRACGAKNMSPTRGA